MLCVGGRTVIYLKTQQSSGRIFANISMYSLLPQHLHACGIIYIVLLIYIVTQHFTCSLSGCSLLDIQTRDRVEQ